MKVAVPERVTDKILARVTKQDDGCWVWLGAKRAGGYGHVGWQDNNVRHYESTHRAIYTRFVGPIPSGMDLDHLCRVRLCCNPQHLEPVTRRENLLRGETTPARRAAIAECPSGHPYSSANTRVEKKNRRICKECGRVRNRAVSPEKKREYNARARARAKTRAI